MHIKITYAILKKRSTIGESETSLSVEGQNITAQKPELVTTSKPESGSQTVEPPKSLLKRMSENTSKAGKNILYGLINRGLH